MEATVTFALIAMVRGFHSVTAESDMLSVPVTVNTAAV